MKVNVINHSHHALPDYKTEGSAGMDIQAFLPESIELKPMERQLISTGLFIELPLGYEAQIRPRSGLAISKGLTVLNAPGTIDSDYRGEIKVILVNLSSAVQVIADGDRIAQMVIARHDWAQWQEALELTDSIRGDGGFGHTGLN